jgi:hypothetical protein
LDAPIYPPAVAFEQPVAVPCTLSLDNVSLAELVQLPTAWSIVTRHIPSLQVIVTLPAFKPHLDNFSVPTMGPFMPMSPQVIAAINGELSQLPPEEGLKP